MTPHTVLANAKPERDPRMVVTPLDANAAEELLCKYNLYDTWKHIIEGLRTGFDVGILEQPSCTYTFRKSLLIRT